MEEWKEIKGYEGNYSVSNQGRIKSYRKCIGGYILSPKIERLNHTSYEVVTLSVNGKKKQNRVHRLVAEAFIDNPENKCCVNHIDNNGTNNHIDNLEWCTQRENLKHSGNQGRLKEATDKANKIQSETAKKNREDMIGKTYGKWTVLEALEREYEGKAISKMLCRCECGKEKEVDMISLKQSRSTQCKSCSAKESQRKRYENSNES